jgi:hypothetical protein
MCSIVVNIVKIYVRRFRWCVRPSTWAAQQRPRWRERWYRRTEGSNSGLGEEPHLQNACELKTQILYSLAGGLVCLQPVGAKNRSRGVKRKAVLFQLHHHQYCSKMESSWRRDYYCAWEGSLKAHIDRQRDSGRSCASARDLRGPTTRVRTSNRRAIERWIRYR